MNLTFQRFSLPKEAESFQDYQDAAFPRGRAYSEPHVEQVGGQPEFRCIVADGATNAVFSKRWAELIVDGYATGQWSEDCIPNVWLKLARRRWRSSISSAKLSYFAQEKAKRGAAAAFVTLKISAQDFKWSAVALGDSCLFHVRNDSVIYSLPDLASGQFDSSPVLLSSRDDTPNNITILHNGRIDRDWKPGDCFYLMSDALACWFSRQIEEGLQQDAIASLDAVNTQEDFERFVAGKRRTRTLGGGVSLKDDDTTLVIVRLNPEGTGTITPVAHGQHLMASKLSKIQSKDNLDGWCQVGMISVCTLLLCGLILGNSTGSNTQLQRGHGVAERPSRLEVRHDQKPSKSKTKVAKHGSAAA